MKSEFEIRAELLYGRAHGEESSSTYEEDRAEAVRAGTGSNSGSDTTVHTAAHRDPVRDAGSDGTDSAQTKNTGGARRLAEGVPPQTVREVDSICDTGADGRTAEGGEASGGDDRTGWETEREIFFAAQNQTAQAAPVASGMGLADSGHGSNGAGYGSVASALVEVGRRLEQSQSAEPVVDATTQHHHTDSKALRKEKQKKIALGHKEDDYEEEQTYTWQQTM